MSDEISVQDYGAGHVMIVSNRGYEAEDETICIPMPDAEAVRLAVALIQATEGDGPVGTFDDGNVYLTEESSNMTPDETIRFGLALIRAAGGK